MCYNCKHQTLSFHFFTDRLDVFCFEFSCGLQDLRFLYWVDFIPLWTLETQTCHNFQWSVPYLIRKSILSNQRAVVFMLCNRSNMTLSKIKAMKSSPLLGLFGDSEFWDFFSVENAIMFQTSDNSQTIVLGLIHHSVQPILIFFRVRVLHLDRRKEGTWFHSFQS